MDLYDGGAEVTAARRILVAAVALALTPAAAAGAPGDPIGLEERMASPANVYRPSVYWWWPGTEVERSEITAEIEGLKQAGFGAAQIVDLEGGAAQGGADWQWGTPKWFELTQHALERGLAEGVRIDLSPYPSWPMSSPAVARDKRHLSATALVHGEQVVVGPMEFSGPPPDASGAVADKTLAAVTAAQPVGGSGSVLDPRTAVDLSDKVDRDGTLHWSVPPGTWTLFGFWSRPSGQGPSTAKGVAQSATGGVSPPGSLPTDQLLLVDPFSVESIDAALGWLSANLMTPDVARLVREHGSELYEDSWEYIYPPGGIPWTPKLLPEFEKRRGYRLQKYLPTLVGQQQYLTQGGIPSAISFGEGLDARVTHDYQDTLADLFIERQRVMERWSRRYGMTGFRHQNYGLLPVDANRAQGGTGIPDVETLLTAYRSVATSHLSVAVSSDAALDTFRASASAAHLNGTRHVNLELGDIIGTPACDPFCVYGQQPADYWFFMHHGFAAGVTRLQMHGYSYRDVPAAPRQTTVLGPQLYPWPNWTPWADVSFSEPWHYSWPQWRFWRPFTDYMARAAQVLSAGKPAVDVLVYRDAVNGANGTALPRAGYTYDFVNPVTLASEGKVAGGRLFADGPAYKALVINPSAMVIPGAIPAQAARKIESFARDGLPVVFVGTPPSQGTSARDAKAEDAVVADAIRRTLSLPNVRRVATVDELPKALGNLGVRADAEFDAPALVRPVHRRTATRDYFYLWNEEDTARVRREVSLATKGAPYVVDPWNNQTVPLARYRQDGDRLIVPVDLGPQEVLVLVVDRRRRAPVHAVSTTADRVTAGDGGLRVESTGGGTVTTTLSDGTATTATLGAPGDPVRPGAWKLHVDEFSPAGPAAPKHDLTLDALTDWQNIPALKYAAGSGTYTSTVTVPDEWVRRDREVYLSLGRIDDAHEVRINGRRVTTNSFVLPEARYPVGALLRPGQNAIEVRMATPPLNRLIGLGQSDPRYAQFTALPPAPSGLIGPVELTPVSTMSLDAAPVLRARLRLRRARAVVTGRAPARSAVVVRLRRAGRTVARRTIGTTSGAFRLSLPAARRGRYRAHVTARSAGRVLRVRTPARSRR